MTNFTPQSPYINEVLASYLKKNKWKSRLEWNEHRGCFGKDCSHLQKEIIIWKKQPLYYCFDETCSPEFIIKTLSAL